MAKITIPDVTAGFSSVSRINTSFQQVEDELNNNVLYRRNPTGESNEMHNDLDMNCHDVLNAGAVDAKVIRLNGQTLTPEIIAIPAAENIPVAPNNSLVSANVRDALYELADEAQQHNYLWQGMLQLWQRGVSIKDFTSRLGTADGWSFARSSFAGGARILLEAGDNQVNALRVYREFGDTNTDACNLVANLSREDSLNLAGKEVTVQFRAQRGAGFTSSTANSIFAAARYSTHSAEQSISSASGQFSMGDNFAASTTAALTEEWQTFSFTFIVPAGATQVSLRFQHVPTGTAVASDHYDLEEVLLVEGAAVGNVTVERFEKVLARAQREFYKSYNTDIAPDTPNEYQGAVRLSAFGKNVNTTFNDSVNLPISMRAPPSVALFSPDTGDPARAHNETDSTDVGIQAVNIGTNGFSVEPITSDLFYEEGTFTPVFGSVTATYNTQTGKFTRVGNMCHVDILMDVATIDTADVSDINVVGLPFDVSDDGLAVVTCNLSKSTLMNFLVTDTVNASLLTAGTALVLSRSTGVNYDYNDGKMNASGLFVISASYRIDETHGQKDVSFHYVAEARL